MAVELVSKVFEVCDRNWRGVGSIPKSGYKLSWEFRDHDAERIFDVKEIDIQEPSICISGLVLKGVRKPHDCPAFGTHCTPEHPLGLRWFRQKGRVPHTTYTVATCSQNQGKWLRHKSYWSCQSLNSTPLERD